MQALPVFTAQRDCVSSREEVAQVSSARPRDRGSQPSYTAHLQVFVRNDDLHSCAQSRREGSAKSRGRVVKGVEGACYIETM
jgi:hypothetical protein